MSVIDPFVVEFYERRGTWIITRGRETFYYTCPNADDPQHYKESCFLCDHQDEMIEFEEPADAVAYAMTYLGAASVELKRGQDAQT